MAQLHEGAKIIRCSDVPSTVIVDQYSTISRCKISGYLAVGCYSFVSRTKIGRYVTIASRCSIGAFNHPTNWLSVSEFQYRDTTYMFKETLEKEDHCVPPKTEITTSIGNDVWVGDNAVILQGMQVGDGAIIGAGSIVTKNVADYSIVVGNPAKHLRYRFSNEIIKRLKAVKWWNKDLTWLKGIAFDDIEAALEQIEARIN